MDEARRLMEEQQAQPAPKPEIAQVEISQAVAQQKIYEGPTFAFKR